MVCVWVYVIVCTYCILYLGHIYIFFFGIRLFNISDAAHFLRVSNTVVTCSNLKPHKVAKFIVATLQSCYVQTCYVTNLLRGQTCYGSKFLRTKLLLNKTVTNLLRPNLLLRKSVTNLLRPNLLLRDQRYKVATLRNSIK